MVRPEKQIDRVGSPAAAFASELRELRRAANLSYKEMAAKVHYSASTLSKAANGDRLASWDVVQAFVLACDGEPGKFAPRWQAARRGEIPDPLFFTTTQMTLLANASMGNSAKPDPTTATTLEELADLLDQYRRNAELTWRALSAKSEDPESPGQALRLSTLHDAVVKKKHPSEFMTLRVAQLCGAEPVELTTWRRVWKEIVAGHREEQPAVISDDDAPACFTASQREPAESPQDVPVLADAQPANSPPTQQSWWKAPLNVTSSRRERRMFAVVASYIVLTQLLILGLVTGMPDRRLMQMAIGLAIGLPQGVYGVVNIIYRLRLRRLASERERIQAKAAKATRSLAKRRNWHPTSAAFINPTKLNLIACATILALVGGWWLIFTRTHDQPKPWERSSESTPSEITPDTFSAYLGTTGY